MLPVVRVTDRVRVLVVDDDVRVRNALRHLLDDVAELQCLAVDSHQAMRLVMWGQVVADVAVVDVPSVSSRTTALVERLADLMPVVVLSMSGSTRDAALAAGAFRFVEKNADVGRLVDVVRLAAAERAGSLAPVTDPGHNVALHEPRSEALPAPGPITEGAEVDARARR